MEKCKRSLVVLQNFYCSLKMNVHKRICGEHTKKQGYFIVPPPESYMWGTEIFVTFFKKYFSAFVSCLKYIIKCEMISGFFI